MRKFIFLFVLCGLISGQAWGGPFSEMKSYTSCGKWSTSDNECYSVGNGRYVECDNDSGDAPAKTRSYWYSSGVWSRRCYIAGSLTGDDKWTDKESVSRCANNSCNSANPREKLPNTSSYYICGKQNQGIKSIGDSVFVGGGTSNAVDCYFFACDKDHPAATSGANIPSSSKRSATCGEGDDPNASGCEEVCVETSGVAKWVKYVKKCKGNMKPGGFHNFGYTKCEADAGSSVVDIECPAGSSKNITSQNNCKEGQTFECTVFALDRSCICGRCTGGSGGSGSGGGSASVGKCHPSVCKSEVCKECCKRPSSETIWDRTAQVCQCVNGGKFQKENDTWSCKVDAGQVTAPDAGYICDATLTAKFAGWKVQCATRTDIMQSIAELEAYCAGKPTKEIFLRLYDEVSVVARMCQQQQQDQRQQQEEQRRQEERAKAEALRKSRRNISDAHGILVGMRETFKASVWKDEEGKFNTSRLVSDSIAGVVLGTVGGVVTSSVVKKNQVENGFEDIKCTVGGQTVADWGDEFRVGIQ